MLNIRPEQLQALGDYTRQQFELRMLKHLRKKFAKRTADVTDEIIIRAVKQGMIKANTYAIEYEDDIRQFIEYLVIYGADMDVSSRTRWIGDILRREDLNGSAKLELIDRTELTLRPKRRHQ